MVGTILFLPIKITAGKTCLFHHVFWGDVEATHIDLSNNNNAAMMLNRYMIPFALIWWLSLALLVFGIGQPRKWRIKSD